MSIGIYTLSEKYDDAWDWCSETFNDFPKRWTTVGSHCENQELFVFKHEEDASMFALKWG